MRTPNPDWRAQVEAVLTSPFVAHLGMVATRIEPGECDVELQVQPTMLQHSGVVHAGVSTALADHTAGLAAGTLAPIGHTVVSVEFKVHLLRAATGPRLSCSARVLKPGAGFTVVESDVFDDRGRHTCRLLGTMTYVPTEATGLV